MARISGAGDAAETETAGLVSLTDREGYRKRLVAWAWLLMRCGAGRGYS